MSLNKKYYPRFNSYLIEKILIICGIVFFICFLLFNFIFDSRDLACVFFGLCLSSWFIPVTLSFFKLREGYIILEDGISFQYRFMKNKLLYQDIKCIIISNAQGNYTITKTPYVTVIGGEKDEILQYCIKSPKRHVLTSNNIRYKLGAEIGCYHPKNIREVFKKGSSTIYNYGFVWNKRAMDKLLKGFEGDYYIAASVLGNFRDEFNNIVKTYNLSNERIFVIDDSTNGKFIWN
ncbi:MAG: hypothetical protein NC393_10790 [Clostridium sp.]|nr:hypothetical protein [Clostridium sp.]MCM1172593.1 hypothetical protein [Clostridium sp.]MCM1209092.1 hypothetical protein [Ruminococcus sp.]